MLWAGLVLAAVPFSAGAQSIPGFYVGVEGGANWLLDSTFTTNASVIGGTLSATSNTQFNAGWAVGGMVGYDFVGPRVELEGLYRQNTGTISTTLLGLGLGNGGLTVNQTSVMANVYYDFMADQAFTPYVGAGAGVAFVNTNVSQLNINNTSTQFAYQYMAGVGYKISPSLRLNLEGRYFGTTMPTFQGNGTLLATPVYVSGSYPNNNISVMASLQFKFGAPTVAAAPPPVEQPQAPSFMVFFDWDRSNLSAQALNTIKQAAGAYKTKGSARITATGHTDKSGPDSYNMALSLRRANTVKDALVREGVPATAISVIGKGETQPLVQTADGVREPQNRRVEIVIQ
jgi:outer membrane protein OmpA-like peptidoglycan-associated protein